MTEYVPSHSTKTKKKKNKKIYGYWFRIFPFMHMVLVLFCSIEIWFWSRFHSCSLVVSMWSKTRMDTSLHTFMESHFQAIGFFLLQKMLRKALKKKKSEKEKTNNKMNQYKKCTKQYIDSIHTWSHTNKNDRTIFPFLRSKSINCRVCSSQLFFYFKLIHGIFIEMRGFIIHFLNKQKKNQ